MEKRRITMKTNTMLFVLTLVLTLSLAACGIFERDAGLEGTAWSLIAINGQPILDESAPTLVFDVDGVGGNGPCNAFGGEYQASNGKLTIGPIVSTLMYCEFLMNQESAYFTALQEAAGFKIANGNLQILNADGQVTLTFTPQN
jgi:putative lipoprotein